MQRGKARNVHKLPERFPCGEILVQTHPVKRKWQLSEIIGQGGFGLIYTAAVTDGPSLPSVNYVIKVEPLDNGPLFCEFHFYQRVAKPELITQWTRQNRLQYLGVPQFLGSGQHTRGRNQYRFLVLQRLSFDLQKIFEQSDHLLSESTVLAIGLRMVDALEYIHDSGYCHADIKAANILLGFSNGQTDFNQVYLVDYGLASPYLVEDKHRPYKEDPKRAHDGTTEYTSRDAHNGASPSRRSDLEILGYCMLEWLTGSLPWLHVLNNKDRVRDLKTQYMKDVPGLLKACFGTEPCPAGIRKYLEMTAKLTYTAKPNYDKLRQVLRTELDNEWTLGLKDGSSQGRGVKRGKERAGLPSPELHKVRPGSPSSATKSLGTQTPPEMWSASKRKPPSATNSAPANTKASPVMAVRTAGPAVSASAPGKKSVPRYEGHRQCSVVVTGRTNQEKNRGPDSSFTPPADRRRKARACHYEEVDEGCSQDSVEYSCEESDGDMYEHEETSSQESDGTCPQYPGGGRYSYEYDEDYHPGSDAEESESDTEVSTDGEVQHESVHNDLDEEEPEVDSKWSCSIL